MSSDAYGGTDQTADEPIYIQGQSHFEEVVSESDALTSKSRVTIALKRP